MAAWRLLFIGIVCLLVPTAALACIWDYDTLLQERSRFPDTLELITGKFLRHSKEFYAWRIKDRLAKLKVEPDNLAFMDDLAVAFDKTGQHQRAIEVMLQSVMKKPGRYETEANLGTFYIHAGQLEKGLEHVDAAIRINPDAHFGREKYQRWLVEYLLTRRRDGNLVLPLTPPDDEAPDFAAFVATKLGKKELILSKAELEEAQRGVLGMMRFGHYESPMLLEALAILLYKGRAYRDHEDAKRLAARAYLKASYAVPEAAVKEQYRELAKRVLRIQTRDRWSVTTISLEELESDLKAEVLEAETWFARVRHDERTWIEEGKNPDEEFVRKYYEAPSLSTGWLAHIEDYVPLPVFWSVIAILALLAVLTGRRLLRRRRRPLSDA